MGHGGGGSSVWGHLAAMGGLGWVVCFQRCLPGSSEPCPYPGEHLSLPKAEGLGWLGMAMTRVQMHSCVSVETEADGSEHIDRRSVPEWSR